MFHVGMTPTQVEDLPDDLRIFEDGWWDIHERVNRPVITEEEFEQMEIPEGQMYVPFTGYLNGELVSGRYVRSREGNNIVIDVRINVSRLEQLQRILEQRIGRFYMMERIDERD